MAAEPVAHSIRRVLIIKWSALGDLAIASAIMEDIRRAWPDAEIDLDTLPAHHRLFAHDPRFRQVFGFELRRKGEQLEHAWAWLQKVRNGRYDVLIDLQCNDRSRILITLLCLLGWAPPQRWGFRGGFPYTLVPPRPAQGTHVFEQMRAMLRRGGLATQTLTPVLYPASAQQARIVALRERLGLEDGHYVVLVPGSQTTVALKRWGTDNYRELARLLHAEHGVGKIVLIGGPGERDVCAAIAASSDSIIDLAGQLELLEIAPLCAGATAIIGNDTGPMHFAAAAGRPLLVICGPTDPRRVRPLGERSRAIQRVLPCSNCYGRVCRNTERHACMRGITPAFVAALYPVLSQGRLLAGQTWPGGIHAF